MPATVLDVAQARLREAHTPTVHRHGPRCHQQGIRAAPEAKQVGECSIVSLFEFCCSCLQWISIVLKLPPAVAGVTLLSFAGGSPDLFTQLAAITAGGLPRSSVWSLTCCMGCPRSCLNQA